MESDYRVGEGCILETFINSELTSYCMGKLVAITTENKEIECHNIREGENGLQLRNEEKDTVGYIPYDRLCYVETT